MSKLDDLSKKIKRLNRDLDSNIDELIKATEAYQKEYELQIRRIQFELDERRRMAQTTANYNKATGVKKGGYNAIAGKHIAGYDDVAGKQVVFNKTAYGIQTDLTFKDLTIIEKLKDIDLEAMYGKGAELDIAIKKSLVNAIALNADYDATMDSLAENLLGAGEKLGRLARFAETYSRTSLFGLTRTIDREIAQRMGIKKYLYWGPVYDRRIREFCAMRVGEEFTEAQIQKFPDLNRSGLDGFYSPGGWNCRHRMIPAEEGKMI